jgi:hypothetical protein
VQTELALDEAELRRRDQLSDVRRECGQRAVEIGVPEIEVEELGKRRRGQSCQIALQSFSDPASDREFPPWSARTLDLAKEGSVHGFVPCWWIFFSFLSLNPELWLRPRHFPN